MLAAGLSKEGRVPPVETGRAIARKAEVEADVDGHTVDLEDFDRGSEQEEA